VGWLPAAARAPAGRLDRETSPTEGMSWLRFVVLIRAGGADRLEGRHGPRTGWQLQTTGALESPRKPSDSSASRAPGQRRREPRNVIQFNQSVLASRSSLASSYSLPARQLAVLRSSPFGGCAWIHYRRSAALLSMKGPMPLPSLALAPTFTAAHVALTAPVEPSLWILRLPQAVINCPLVLSQ
jgi:hypothetical protein